VPTAPCLSCAESSRAGCRTPGGVSSWQSRGAESPPMTCWPHFFGAAQDMVGLLACKCTLVAHVQLFTHQYPQVLLGRAALNPFTPQPVLIVGVALTQVKDFALGLVELHVVHMGPLLKLVQVPLDCIPSFKCVNHTTQLGVIWQLAQDALNPCH